jgi:cytochrome P450
MTVFPEKQAIAQAELDRIVGPSRLPNIEDRASLPYIDALIKEILRWNVITPLSVPRRTDKDDIYKGYFIPAGTIVLPNVWSMAFDSSDRAKDFTPERFLASDGPQDPHTYSFGFGRRICPGLQLASNSIFIMIASVLSVFHISKQKDELGNEIPVHPSFVWDGLVSHPEPFKCSFSPRSAAAVNLFKPGPST